MDQSKSRSIRLLASFTELEREVREQTTMHAHNTPEKGGDYNDINLGQEYESWLTRKCTCCKALRARVGKDELTEEFRVTRGESEYDFLRYKTIRLWRSKWAQFFLCNLDWDWDLAGTLERLYLLDETSPSPHAQTHHSETYIATIDAEGVVGHTWDMKTTSTQLHTDLPKEVRIPYASETGDLTYMVFSRDAELSGPSVKELTSLSDHDDDFEERESLGTTKVDECTSGNVPSRTQCCINEIAGVEGLGNSAATASETSWDSGSSLGFQACDCVSWSAQDIDGLPVVPCAHEALVDSKAFIEELDAESEGEGTTSGTSAKLTQVCL